MRFRLVILLLLGALRLCGEEVVLLAVSDMHAHWPAMLRLQPVLEEERRAAGPGRSLTVDAGDTMQGTREALFRHGLIPMLAARQLGIDLWCPGNHDFEIRPFRFSDFSGTVLGANWQLPGFRPVPWLIRRLGDRRIAVIGLTETNLPHRLPPGDPLRTETPEAALRRILPAVRAARPDLIVLLRHDSLYFRGGTLERLLRRFPEIDLVIGGHTHEAHPGERVGRAFFVQPGKHAEQLAVIRVEFDDATGKLRRIRSRLRAPAAQPASPSPALSDAIREEALLADRIAGDAPEPVRRSTERVDRGSFARLTGNAMCAATGAAAAIYSSAPAEFSLPQTLRRRDLFRLYPFENIVCSIRVTPEELRVWLAEECALLRRGRRTTLFAGFSFELDRRGVPRNFALPPVGSDGRIAVALTDYLLSGSGGLTPTPRRLADAGAPVVNTGLPLREAVRRQLRPAAPDTSAQLQGSQRQQRKDAGENPEADHNL